jgi:hypothetical protein
MKKLLLSGFIAALVSILCSFQPDNSHRNIITFDDGLSWVWKADNCTAGYVPALSTRSMISSKGFHMVDLTFQLPAGHCDIPTRGTTVTRYEGQNQWAVIHADGFVQGKVLVTPKK